jgi:flagellar L-ring protein precursor FlgH
MMRRQALAWLPLLLSILPGVASAQSLWQQRHPQKAFLFYDTQARRVGDILTVLVRETTDVENRDQRALDRAADASGGFSLSAALSGDFGQKSGDGGFDLATNGNGAFDGSSAYSVERGFTDRITVFVVDELPNGNLVIRGTRNRVVSGERRALTISGVVRPIDIRADNLIESQYIANFHVCYDGDGIESRFTDEGWLTRTWNKYRPL